MAQSETGAVTGTVTDQSGAVVPNAKVVAKNLATNATRTAVTNADGIYTIPNLPPATYQVSVEASGFATVQKQATVQVGSRMGVDVQLSVGQTGTVVEVQEAALAVNTETQTLSTTVTTRQIVELPTLNRDPYALAATSGNVSGNTPDGRGVGLAINGQRASSTNVLLDGMANNDEFGAGVGQRVPLDSVQEFSILTNNFTAEFGRATGGVVNVVTKSGGNEFHGSAYEFNRLSALASNTYDNNANGIPRQVFTRNQFGYSVGGPAVKNKLFFFSSTEWTRIRSYATSTVWIPTSQLISAAAPNTQQFFSTYGALKSNLNVLGTYSKQTLQSAFNFNACSGLAATSMCAQLSPTLPIFQRLAYNSPNDAGGGFPTNIGNTVNRVDYNLSEKTQMFVRYALYSQNDFDGASSASAYQGFDTPNTQYNNSVVYSLTKTITPSFISQTKVDYNRFNNKQPFSSKWASVPTLYMTTSGGKIGNDNIVMPGFNPTTPGSSIPFGGPQNFLQLNQDLSWQKGRHNFRFGGQYTYLRDNRTFGAYQDGNMELGTTVPKGIENFLQGLMYQYQGAVNPQGKFPCGATVTPDCTLTLPVGQPNFSRSNRYHDWALYAQDSYKLTPRLTLNLGLRWEVFGTQHNKDPKLDSNLYLGTGDIFSAVATSTVQLAPNSPIGKLWNTAYGNFGPRIGVAWDLFGDGKTSFRAGYSRAYERNFGNVLFNVIQNPPNYAVLSLVAGSDLPSIPITTANAGPLGGSTGSKALGKVSLRGVDPNIKTAYAHLWSASIERAFGRYVAALEYSGSKGENQYGIANYNRAGFANYYQGVPCTPGTDGDPGNCTTRLRTTQYSNINFRTNGGFSLYNGLNARLDIRGSKGLNMRMNYTWSHAIDTLSDTFSSGVANLGWLDPFHPSLDKGDAFYDLRHRFVVAGTWDFGMNNAKGIQRQVLGGWTLAPIWSAQTGAPFVIYDCSLAYNVCPFAFAKGAVPVNGDGVTATATPNVYNYLNLDKHFDSSWYDKKTGISDIGVFPANMVGRNRFRGPGNWNVDLGIYKKFYVGERYNLQFRAEGYNFFNHANLQNPGYQDVSNGGYVTTYYNGRRFYQMALKLTF